MKTIMTMVYRLWKFVPRDRHHYNNSQVHRKHSWCWPSTLWCVSHSSQRKLPFSVMVSTPLLCLTVTGVTQPTMVSTPQHLWQLTACTAGISHIFSQPWSLDHNSDSVYHYCNLPPPSPRPSQAAISGSSSRYIRTSSCCYRWMQVQNYKYI